MDLDQAKHVVRERVSDLLEREHAAPLGVHGRTLAFFGAEQAADPLVALRVRQAAHVVNAVPDTAQEPVRAHALRDGKLVHVAVPKLAKPLPLYLLDPTTLSVLPKNIASKQVAGAVGRPVITENKRPVDLTGCGSVAVNRRGIRPSKGTGYSNIGVALLQKAGLIGPNTTIATVHGLQVVHDELAQNAHDFNADLTVDADEVIPCGEPRQPHGLVWSELRAPKIAAIPALTAQQEPS